MKKLLLNIVLIFLCYSPAHAQISIGTEFVSTTSALANRSTAFYTFTYNVTAIGGDVFLPTLVNTYLSDFSSPISEYLSSTSIVSIPNALEGNGFFHIPQGFTEQFTLTMMVRPEQNMSTGVTVAGIYWNTVPAYGYSSTTGQLIGNYTPVDWPAAPTQQIQGTAVPEPTTLMFLTPALGFLAFSRRRK